MSLTSSLLFAMGTSDTSLQLSSSSPFPGNGGVITIDSETIIYGYSTDRTLVQLVRGAEGSTPATHAIGASITLVESYPFMPFPDLAFHALTMTSLLDPTAVPTADVIERCNVLLVNFDSSGVNQTWTLPVMDSPVRKLTVLHKAASAKTLSVNSVSIAAGTGQEFAYDGSAWYAV